MLKNCLRERCFLAAKYLAAANLPEANVFEIGSCDWSLRE